MWDFSSLFSDLGDKLMEWGENQINDVSGGMVDYIKGNIKPTDQSSNLVENVIAGGKNPGWGKMFTDIQAGNYASALGNAGAMGAANAPSASQIQQIQAQQQANAASDMQKQIEQQQADFFKQQQEQKKHQEQALKTGLQVAAIFGL